jgi:serine protease Do
MAWKGWTFGLVFALCVITTSRFADADQYKPSISVQNRRLGTLTFSRIVVRLSANEIGVEGNHLRIQFIETLRRLGYAARGAESLVFDQDDSNSARFVLGGTASEIQCRSLGGNARRCWLGVTWELLDRQNNRVTYRAHTRHAGDGDDPVRLADELIWGTFYSLLSRQTFVTALSGASSRTPVGKPNYAKANYLRCSRADAPMPTSAEALMQATVVVQAGERTGSGTVISGDGFVLTAAHVVAGRGPVYVQSRHGPKIEAGVIRLNAHSDVALLKARSGSEYPCIAIRREPVTVGEDLFAIGSPVAKELAFTLTRGVVSGVRTIDDVSLVQTDASINRGNSGGPLLDAKGRLVGVVSWKIVESGVEGIAFGISMQATLSALALEPADQSDSVLSRASAPAAGQKTASGVDDIADSVPALWPVHTPRPRAPPTATPSPPKKRRGPKTASAKLYGTTGLITAGVGAVGVGVTYALFQSQKDTLRQGGFDNLRLANDISWVTVLGGATLFGISELLPRERVPDKKLPPKKTAGSRGSWSVGIGPASAVLVGSY